MIEILIFFAILAIMLWGLYSYNLRKERDDNAVPYGVRPTAKTVFHDYINLSGDDMIEFDDLCSKHFQPY